MPIAYLQREAGAKVWTRTTCITSNAECACCYGSNTRSKWLEGTAVELWQELSKSGTRQEWYITSDYILGEDDTTKRVHISQRGVKFVPVPPPETES